ncbi:MAG: hypothetical protein QM758_14395 [Armatimonas sp.]
MTDRLLRLGIPSFLLLLILFLITRQPSFGPMWYAMDLLALSILYAALRARNQEKPPSVERADAPHTLTNVGVLLFTVALSLAAAVVRVWFPIDKWVNLLWLFPLEPAHAPQYLFFFGAGLLLSFRNSWLQRIRNLWLWSGARWDLLGQSATACVTSLASARHGFLWKRAAGTEATSTTTLLESFVAVGVSIALLALFQRRFNGLNFLLRFLSASAFGVYFIHILVVVPIQMVLLPPPGDRYRSFWWRPPWPILSPL